MTVVQYQRRERLVAIRLNRPDHLNALTRQMMDDLRIAFERIEREENLRTVVITGNGRAFCSGTDIIRLVKVDENGARDLAIQGQELCKQIEHCSVPVIAAINGIAAGGGCELALACHLRIASTNAEFSLPETTLGVTPGYGGTQRLAREIGRARALEIILTGRRISATEAFRIGLINQVCESAALYSQVEMLASDIAQQAPLAVRACLRAVVDGMPLTLEDGLALEAECFARLFGTKDMKEGTRAFLEKRVAKFTGT